MRSFKLAYRFCLPEGPLVLLPAQFRIRLPSLKSARTKQRPPYV